MNLTLLLPIALGGATGAIARYVMASAVMARFSVSGFPYGTLAVNVVGSLLIGLLAGWLLRESVEVKPALQAFIITGFLGGFTTFSAFSLDTLTLLQRGETLPALAYIGASIILTLAACALGFWLVKAL